MQFSLPDYHTILQIHEIVIEEFGGFNGIPHPDYIRAAIVRPENYMAYDANCDLHLVAAIILNSITTYHAFSDGNKRTALIAMLMTYRMNNINLEFNLMVNTKLENLVLEVANSETRPTIRELRNKLKIIVEEFIS